MGKFARLKSRATERFQRVNRDSLLIATIHLLPNLRRSFILGEEIPLINSTLHICGEKKVLVGMNCESGDIILLQMKLNRMDNVIAHEKSVCDAVIHEQCLVVGNGEIAAIVVAVFRMI